eukprot:CFRG2265T1
MSRLRQQVFRGGKGDDVFVAPEPAVRPKRGPKDYSALPYSDFFTDKRIVSLPDRDNLSVRVYTKGEDGPVILLLHGGGYSGLTWAAMVKHLTTMVDVQIVAPDTRGHGDTRCTSDNQLDRETQCTDIGDLVRVMYGTIPPPIVVVGHSMGGAMAVHLAHGLYIPSLCGLVVIDVIEGSAMDSLGHMGTVLASRPSIFQNMANAIEWSMRSGHVRNLESARVSMPGQLVTIEQHKTIVKAPRTENLTDGIVERVYTTKAISSSIPEGDENVDEGTHAFTDTVRDTPRDLGTNTNCNTSSGVCGQKQGLNISACVGENENKNKSEYVKVSDGVGVPASIDVSSMKDKLIWRTDLLATEPYWRGWFEGISHLFLSTNVPKLVVLGGIDRMDTEMSVAHMQGKYQLKVMSSVGHMVHEDVPVQVAECLAEFVVRNRIASPKDMYNGLRPLL